MSGFRVEAGNPGCLGATKNSRGVNFAVVVRDRRECSLLLYSKGSAEPEQEIVFTEEMRFEDVCAVQVLSLPADGYEYNYVIDGVVTVDPYARLVRGRERWGVCPEGEHTVRSALPGGRFSWRGDRPLRLPFEECVMYVTHPRGFTMDKSAKVHDPGTFAGLSRKIPYLKRLGINQLELMPVYEFAELKKEKRSRRHMPVSRKSAEKINYWGYGEACFFAPKASYSASGDPVRELKELVRKLHGNGIELILEFAFPARTDPNLVIDCIRYWQSEYHIDGFHISGADAALQVLAADARLAGTKFYGSHFAFDALYGPDEVPAGRHLAECHERFQWAARRFLRGDAKAAGEMAVMICRNPEQSAAVNYITGHNGFTLADLVSYERKHNEANGEDNRDGNGENISCNYGSEGPAKDEEILLIRRKQVRNAFLLMLLSQGVPCIYGGDEMGNSQGGNNNVYCQDNETGWVQWAQSREDKKLQQFVRRAVAFRRNHPAFGRRQPYRMKDYLSKGMPDLSFHSGRAWYGDFESGDCRFGILYAGAYLGGETCFVLCNMDADTHEMALPLLPGGQSWYVEADSSLDGVFLADGGCMLPKGQKTAEVPPRTIMILAGR